MKRLFAAVLAILCLAGCSSKPEQTEMIGVTVVTGEENPVVETPVVEEVPVEVEETVTEEPEAELTEDAPADAIDTYAMSEDKLEGLVGDTIGYSFMTPSFDGFPAAEKVTNFYADLAAHLEGYTKETVNETCLNNSLMASVYGELTDVQIVNNGLGLKVDYEFRVEFSDGTEERRTRTDTFDIQTGEVTSVTE